MLNLHYNVTAGGNVSKNNSILQVKLINGSVIHT